MIIRAMRRFIELIFMLFLMQNMGCTTHRTVLVAPPPPACHRIVGDQLTIDVMDPNDPLRYNHGVRFSPVAAILQVQLNGHSFLFCPDEHDPIADHGGLPAEFDLVAPGDPDAWMPPGYNEAKVGGGFMKVGVGVLKKQKGRYSLFQQPELIAPAPVTVAWRRNGATFQQICPQTDGYACELSAEITCNGERIIVDWKLINIGEKAFTTRQYIHNFFRFDDHDVGPDYVLRFPYEFSATGLEAQQRQVGRSIQFVGRIPQWVNMVVSYPPDYAGPNVCTLEQTQAKLAVRCETSLSSIRTAIHARPMYLSPEQFIELSLRPGESATWRRSYSFTDQPGKP